MSNRTSCLPHPSDDLYINLRQWVLTVVDRDLFAALAIANMEYRHNWLHVPISKKRAENDKAIQLGKIPPHDETHFTYIQEHTISDLRRYLFNLPSRATVRAKLDYLEEREIIVLFDDEDDKQCRQNLNKPKRLLFRPWRLCQHHHKLTNERLPYRISDTEINDDPKLYAFYMAHLAHRKSIEATKEQGNLIITPDELIALMEENLAQQKDWNELPPHIPPLERSCQGGYVPRLSTGGLERSCQGVNRGGNSFQGGNSCHPAGTNCHFSGTNCHPYIRKNSNIAINSSSNTIAAAVDNVKKRSSAKAGKTIEFAVKQCSRMPDERQKFLRERLAKIGVGETEFTWATWVGAIELEMNNPESFKKATSSDYKLNCIFAKIKQGQWTPMSILPASLPAVSKPTLAEKLKQTLQQLYRDKQGWEQVVNNPQPYQTGSEYASSAKRELAAVVKKIADAKAEIQATQAQENAN